MKSFVKSVLGFGSQADRWREKPPAINLPQSSTNDDSVIHAAVTSGVTNSMNSMHTNDHLNVDNVNSLSDCDEADVVTLSDDMNKKPIHMKLNNNTLIFDGKYWITQSNDIEQATKDIVTLLNNYDILHERYESSKLLIDSLRNEIIEVNDLKTSTLNILLEEKEKSKVLLTEISLYKNELKNSYVIIEELRDIITKLTKSDEV